MTVTQITSTAITTTSSSLGEETKKVGFILINHNNLKRTQKVPRRLI
jgi:hypothetical protein